MRPTLKDLFNESKNRGIQTDPNDEIAAMKGDLIAAQSLLDGSRERNKQLQAENRDFKEQIEKLNENLQKVFNSNTPTKTNQGAPEVTPQKQKRLKMLLRTAAEENDLYNQCVLLLLEYKKV